MTEEEELQENLKSTEESARKRRAFSETRESFANEPEEIHAESTEDFTRQKRAFTGTRESFTKQEKIEDFYHYAKANRADTIAYIAMILGLFLLFFTPFIGGIFVGIVFGLYFSKEMLVVYRHPEKFIDRLGMVRSLILGGLLLAFFIAAPAIYLAAGVVLVIKQLLIPDKL